MPMMTSDTAGPVLGNEDGRMVGANPADRDQDQDQDTDMVPCAVCHGTGMVPASEAQNPDMGQDLEEGTIPEAPKSPVTGRTGADIQNIRNYAANRPMQLQHQPIDENAAAAQGSRVRQRMRQAGRLGR